MTIKSRIQKALCRHSNASSTSINSNSDSDSSSSQKSPTSSLFLSKTTSALSRISTLASFRSEKPMSYWDAKIKYKGPIDWQCKESLAAWSFETGASASALRERCPSLIESVSPCSSRRSSLV